MKKRILLCLIFLFMISFSTGCWSSRELDKLSIVQAIGIDQGENGQIRLTAEILIPSKIKSPGASGGGSSGGKVVWVLKSTGETVFDALRNATFESDRKLYLSFNKIIVIGEEAAKEGIAPFLDFFARDHEIRGLAYIFIARGKVEDIMEASTDQEAVTSKVMENLAENTSVTSKAVKVHFYELQSTLASKTSDPFLTGIEIIKQQKNDQEKKLLRLNDTAIFDQDRLIGWFNGKETRGLLWVLGEVKSGIIVVPSPGQETEKVSIEILNASSEIKPEIINGKLVITVKIKENASIGEQMSANANADQPEIFRELEKRQAAAIKEEINAALEKGQKEWGVDIFKFGEEVHRKFPKEWQELKENWDEEIKNIEVHVEVEAKLRMFGKSTFPKE